MLQFSTSPNELRGNERCCRLSHAVFYEELVSPGSSYAVGAACTVMASRLRCAKISDLAKRYRASRQEVCVWRLSARKSWCQRVVILAVTQTRSPTSRRTPDAPECSIWCGNFLGNLHKISIIVHTIVLTYGRVVHMEMGFGMTERSDDGVWKNSERRWSFGCRLTLTQKTRWLQWKDLMRNVRE